MKEAERSLASAHAQANEAKALKEHTAREFASAEQVSFECCATVVSSRLSRSSFDQ